MLQRISDMGARLFEKLSALRKAELRTKPLPPTAINITGMPSSEATIQGAPTDAATPRDHKLNTNF